MAPDMDFKYEILTTVDLEHLQRQTEELLNDHYQVVGPIIPYQEHGVTHFLQGMIQASFKNTPKPEQDSEEEIAKVNEAITQALAENMGSYTKDLMEVNNLHLEYVDGAVMLYRKSKQLGQISGSSLLAEIRTGKHAPVDLDENKVLTELDNAIVKALGVSEDENAAR